VEDDDVGMFARDRGETRGAVERREHFVVARAEVDPQRSAQRGLVVDDENLRHDAVSRVAASALVTSDAGSDTVIVRPPPGVSPASMVPPTASTKPRATASPSPTPVVASWSPSRWNGAKIRSRSDAGTPGP